MSTSARQALYRQVSSYVNESFLEDSSHIAHNSNVVEVLPVLSSTYKRRNHDAIATDVDKPFKESSSSHKSKKYPWPSFIVIYTMIFFNGCCFTAVVPSVPFYLQVLDAPPSFLGWVVSFYSLGQILGSPLAGYLTSILSNKRLLTINSSLGLFSSVVYAIAPVYLFILFARLLTGISAGMEFTTELTFIAKNTTKQERTTFLASVTAVNVVGFIMGPALGSLLATLNIQILGVSVDQYTGPGWLLACMFVVDLIMVQCVFEDHEIIEIDTDTESDADAASEKEELIKRDQLTSSYGGVNNKSDNRSDHQQQDKTDDIIEPPPSLSMVLSLILVQFTVMCAFSVLETITSPVAQDNFDWDVQECNLLFTAGGGVSLIAYVVLVVASRWVQDRWLIVYALVLCFIGLVLAIDWQQLPWSPLWLTALLPPYLHRFLAGYLIMNAGFMTGRPVTFALYSKLIPCTYQGTYLGYMVAGGSAARTLGPFVAVALYYGVQQIGLNLLAVFGSVGIFHILCLLLVYLKWRSLLPTKSRDEMMTERGQDGDDDSPCEIDSECDSSRKV